MSLNQRRCQSAKVVKFATPAQIVALLAISEEFVVPNSGGHKLKTLNSSRFSRSSLRAASNSDLMSVSDIYAASEKLKAISKALI